MQLDSLRYFVELATSGSFYRAAKGTYLSQQGLNKAITSLEEELGIKLIERSRRGVRLTTGGDIFLEYARSILEDYDRLLDELYAEESRSNSSDFAPLVIHVTYYLAQISGPFINGLGIRDSARVVEERFHQVLDKARGSDGSELFLVDVYAGSQDILAQAEDLVFEPLVLSQLGVVWRDGSPLAGHRVIHREQLENYPLAVDSHREMMKMIEDVMQDYPLNDIRLGVAEPRATIGFASSSNQVAATFDSFGFALAQKNPNIPTEGLHFTPLSTPRSLCQVGLVYGKGAKPNTRCRHAIDRLKKYLRENHADYFRRYPLDRK